MKRTEAAFYQGLAVGVAVLIRRDEPTLGLEIMTTNGVTLNHLIDADVDSFDLDPIRKAWAKEFPAPAPKEKP